MNENRENIIEYIVNSLVLTPEEKQKWLFRLPNISDEKIQELLQIFRLEKDVIQGKLPQNLSEDQMREIGSLIKNFIEINSAFRFDVRVRQEKKSDEADQSSQVGLLRALETLEI